MFDSKRKDQAVGIALALLAIGCAASLSAQQPSAPSTPAPATTSATAPALVWKNYAYPEEGFSASFPAKPEFDKKDIPTEWGSFELRTYSMEANSAALSVVVCNYGMAIEDNDPDDLLYAAENGALKNSNSHLLSDRKIALGAYHGLAFESESETAHLSIRLYFVGSTLYQSLVVYPIGKPFDGTTRFHDSFQLIARVAK